MTSRLGNGTLSQHFASLVFGEKLAIFMTLNKYIIMKSKVLRPKAWKVQGEIPHAQHLAWSRAKAQANYRKEVWLLTFEEFQQVWMGYWHRRGRGSTDYCMSREDPYGAWAIGNVSCIQRREYLCRQNMYKVS